MDRYEPTTNHPRERSLFFLSGHQIPLCLPLPSRLLSPDQPEIYSILFRFFPDPSRSYPIFYLPRFFLFHLLFLFGLSPRRTRVRLLVPAIATHSSRNYICKRGTHFDLYTLASVHELSLLTKRVVGAGRVCVCVYVCVCVLTELVGKQWRGELRFVSGAPVFADVAVTVTSSSSSSSSSLHDSSRSLLRSFVRPPPVFLRPTNT